jgi:hypothetical protein
VNLQTVLEPIAYIIVTDCSEMTRAIASFLIGVAVCFVDILDQCQKAQRNL